MAHSVPEPFGLFPLHVPLPTAVLGLLPGRRFSCILWGLIWVVVDPPEPLLLRGWSSRMVTLLLGNSMWSCLQPLRRRLAWRSQRGVDCAQTCGGGHSQEPPRTMLGEGERPPPFPWRTPALSHLTPEKDQRLLGAHSLLPEEGSRQRGFGISNSCWSNSCRSPSALVKESWITHPCQPPPDS